MARKPSRRYLIKKADKLFSLYIRARDRECKRCHTTENLQCAHVISRRYHATRWDPLNAMALCRGCHLWQTTHPLEGEVFFKQVLGDGVFEGLATAALAYGKPDLEGIIEWLKLQTLELKRG